MSALTTKAHLFYALLVISEVRRLMGFVFVSTLFTVGAAVALLAWALVQHFFAIALSLVTLDGFDDGVLLVSRVVLAAWSLLIVLIRMWEDLLRQFHSARYRIERGRDVKAGDQALLGGSATRASPFPRGKGYPSAEANKDA